MKPIRMSIAGLNSFRERQEIDFTKLTELGMFGIFGPTGSGKSSILDAITLALYGHVVRADRSTQGILNQAEKKLEISFDFEIGAGSQRKRYRVERLYRRGGAGEYSVQNQASRLLQLERGVDGADTGLVVVADSKRDVDRAILGIVGLEQSDFTRAVVLPQGKFAEFLQLTGTERNAMTERLFGLERLGQSLLRRVSERGRAAEHAKGVIEAQQAELGDASEDAVKALEVALEAVKVQVAEAETARNRARAAVEELQRIADATRRLSEFKAEQGALLSRAPEIQLLRHSLERHRHAQAIWPHVTAWKEAANSAETAQTRWSIAAAEAKRAQAELDAATARWHQARARRDAEEPGLRERLGGLTEAERIEQELVAAREAGKTAESALKATAASASESVASRDRLAASLDRSQQKLTEAEGLVAAHAVTPEMRRALAALQKAYEAWRAQAGALTVAQGQLRDRQAALQAAAGHVQAARAQRQQLTDELQRWTDERRLLDNATPVCTREMLSSLQTWQTRVEARLVTLRDATQQEVEAKAGAVTAQRRCAEVQQRAQVLRSVAVDAEARLYAAREAQQQLVAEYETALIVRLQGRLGDGVPCPVCGSTHYASPTPSDVYAPNGEDQARVDVDEQLQRAQVVWRDADADAQAAEREAAQAETTAQLLAAEASNKERQRIALQDELRQMWMRELQYLGLDVLPQSFGEWQCVWSLVCDRLAQAVSEREAWERREETLRSAMTELTERQRTADHALELAQAVERAAEAEASAQGAQVTEASNAVTMLAAALQHAVRDCQPGAAVDTADPAVLSGRVRGLLQWAEDSDRLLAESQARVTELRGETAGLQRQLAVAERQVAETEREVSIARTRVEHFQVEVAALDSKLRTYTDGIAVSVVRVGVERTLAGLLAESQAAEERLHAANETTQAARQAEATAALEYTASEQALTQQERQLTDGLAAAGFANVPDLEDARLTDGEAADRTARVEQYDAALARTEAVVADLEAQLDGRTGDEDTLRLATAKWKAAEEHYNVCAKAEGAAQENLTQILLKRSRWEKLERERSEAVTLCTRISAIARVLRGNAFVRFVAKEQMERVARQASARLSSLTHGRYTLLIDDQGDFLMRDDHNGGSTRPVSTLSGGETFLTSLSLALALSAHIQLRGQHPLEFFFLDEGFGTLDPELLDVVVTSLERLNLDRLSVGLISHVPELRQRLQRRLIVEPALPAGRGTTVRLEFA